MTSKGSSSRKRKADDDAVESETLIRVALKGQEMSYTYLAAQKFFQNYSNAIDFVPNTSVQDVFDRVLREECVYGLVPLESSSFGTIHTVYDRLLASNGQLQIIGEIGLIELHCLCVKANAPALMELDVQRVISHPHIMECCNDYLKSIDSRRHALNRAPLERLSSWDSAAGCETVANSQEEMSIFHAAICSKEAAKVHNLRVLKEGIGNDQNAETRYIVIAKRSPGASTAATGSTSLPAADSLIDPLKIASEATATAGKVVVGTKRQHSNGSGRNKASVALALRNLPGALFKMASCFAFRNIDITKVESRPATIAMQINLSPEEKRPFTQRHWDLIFYLDFEPSDQPEINEALFTNLHEYCLWIRVLGQYRSGLHLVHTQPSEWSHIVDVVSY